MSENMHYEILRCLNWKDLIDVRLINLGGFQMVTNQVLRNKLKNYMNKCPLLINTQDNEYSNIQKIRLLFQQMGKNLLRLVGDNAEKQQFRNIIRLCNNQNTYKKIKELEIGTFFNLKSYNLLVDRAQTEIDIFGLTCHLWSNAFRNNLSVLKFGTTNYITQY